MLRCLQITSTYLAHREQSQRMIRLDPNTDCLLGYDQTSLRHLEALPSDPHTPCCQATYTDWAEMTQNFPGKVYVETINLWLINHKVIETALFLLILFSLHVQNMVPKSRRML